MFPSNMIYREFIIVRKINNIPKYCFNCLETMDHRIDRAGLFESRYSPSLWKISTLYVGLGKKYFFDPR